jgi:enterochelin esterase family protein
LLLLIAGSSSALCQSVAPTADDLGLRSPRLKQLWEQIQAGTPDAEAQFFAGLTDGTPLVEPVTDDPTRSLVTFLWRGKPTTRRVAVIGGRPVTDWEAPLEKLPGTEIWYRTELLPSDARFTYSMIIDGLAEQPDKIEEILNLKDFSAPDPLNPRIVDQETYVVLPQALPFPYPMNAQAPKGKISDESIKSRILGTDVALKVYVPANHASKSARPRPWLLVAFDGGFEAMGTVLDDLIASGKVAPVVAVGVINRKDKDGKTLRPKDLGYSEDFAKFVTQELIPWARRHYRTSESRSHTIIAGDSRGGGMAAFVALRYPGSVSKVLGARTALENTPGYYPPTRFWLDPNNGWLIERYLEAPRRPLEFYLAIGRFDTSLWTDRLMNNRRFRDVLRAKGYRVHYAEWSGGHDPLLVQHAYVEGLMALAPGHR